MSNASATLVKEKKVTKPKKKQAAKLSPYTPPRGAITTKTQTAKKTTRVTVRYDVGLNNELFMRGKGANLNWEKGVRLTNLSANEWFWESKREFKTCEFKVLINDVRYENGENNRIASGKTVEYTPDFS
jgi:hypothetical protein